MYALSVKSISHVWCYMQRRLRWPKVSSAVVAIQCYKSESAENDKNQNKQSTKFVGVKHRFGVQFYPLL